MGTSNTADDLVTILKALAWFHLCDACEAIYDSLVDQKNEYQLGLNQTFARNHFGYEMRAGQIERVGALTYAAAVEEARAILRDPELGGPSRQFQKAVAFFNERPSPDCANAVKEAVGAVEGLARILLEQPSILLPAACARLRQTKGMHAALAQMVEKLYAFRGDAEGVSHGDTGSRPVTPEEAELAVGVSASTIVYFARLFGRAIQ